MCCFVRIKLLKSGTFKNINLHREIFPSRCVIKVSLHEFGIPSFLIGYGNDTSVFLVSREVLLHLTIRCWRKEANDPFSYPLRAL